MDYQTKNNIQYHCTYHIVWSTKYRRNVLLEGIEARCEEMIKETCSHLSVEIQTLFVTPSYVELQLSCNPQETGIHSLVKQLKSVTSHELRTSYPELKRKLPTLWTNSYFIETIGTVNQEAVQEYLASQPNTWRK